MGEKAHRPPENGFSKENSDNSDQEMPHENDANESEDISPEEFQMLDGQLDALNTALDDIEQKNDNIHAQLLQLLQSNRDIRKQLQESNGSTSQDVEKPNQ